MGRDSLRVFEGDTATTDRRGACVTKGSVSGVKRRDRPNPVEASPIHFGGVGRSSSTVRHRPDPGQARPPDSADTARAARPAFRHPLPTAKALGVDLAARTPLSTPFGRRSAERRQFARPFGRGGFVGGENHHLAAAPRPAVTGAPRYGAEGTAPARPTGGAEQAVAGRGRRVGATLDHWFPKSRPGDWAMGRRVRTARASPPEPRELRPSSPIPAEHTTPTPDTKGSRPNRRNSVAPGRGVAIGGVLASDGSGGGVAWRVET